MLRGCRACRTCYENATIMFRRCYEETVPVEFSLNVAADITWHSVNTNAPHLLKAARLIFQRTLSHKLAQLGRKSRN